MKTKNMLTLTMLGLMLGGAAGAQCSIPSLPQIPRFTRTQLIVTNAGTYPWQFDYGWSTFVTDNTGAGTSDGTGVQGIFTSIDDNRPPYSVTLPSTSKQEVKYLKIAVAFANNNLVISGGHARFITFSYGGKVYARMHTSPYGAPKTTMDDGFVYADNGAQVFDKTGRPAQDKDPHGLTSTPGIIVKSTGTDELNTLAARTGTLNDATLFFLLLPDNIPDSGEFKITSSREDVKDDLQLVDDVVIFKPETVNTSFCLAKQIDNTAPKGQYSFTITPANSSSAKTANINVETVGQSVEMANALLINSPYIDIREMTSGNYAISDIVCKSQAFTDSNYFTRPETGVETIVDIPGDTSINTPLGKRGFRVYIPSGSATNCTITNSGAKAPQFTVNKVFNLGRYSDADQANITLTSGNSNLNYITKGTGSIVDYSSNNRTLSPTITYKNSGTTSPQNGKYTSSQDSVYRDTTYNFSATETIDNSNKYNSSYICTKSDSNTPLASGSGSSLSISANLNDNVVCTFTNTLAAPVTNVELDKSGPKVQTAGQVIVYTLSVQNKTDQPVAVDLIDKFFPALDPGSQVTIDPPESGIVFDPATQTTTWKGLRLNANSTVVKTLKVVTGGYSQDKIQGDDYTGRRQINNLAAISNEHTIDSNGNIIPTKLTNLSNKTNASVTTDILFVSLRKTVRNVSQNGTAGTEVNAKPGDILEYCLKYTNKSAVPMALTLTDTLVDGQTLIPDSVTNGTPTLDKNKISIALPNVVADANSTVCFQVRVNGDQ